MPIAFAIFCTATGSRPPAATLLEEAKDGEEAAAADKPYFLAILDGEFPEVPDGLGDDDE